MPGGEKHFGGDWTRAKLDILEKYLDAYTTALKNQPFQLIYIDAFAGTGRVALSSGEQEGRRFLSGSAERAVQVGDKPFDKLIFVEKDANRCEKLEGLCAAHSCRKVEIVNQDANAFLGNFQADWRRWRGVLFLDPFATQVEWATIERVARLRALDTWILFPASAIARMLPKSQQPDDISKAWVNRLSSVYGGDSWRGLYKESPQGELFGDKAWIREPGVEYLLKIYKDRLAELFGKRFLPTSRMLRNSKDSPLFEFLFCVGNERGIRPATRIAEYILNNL